MYFAWTGNWNFVKTATAQDNFIVRLGSFSFTGVWVVTCESPSMKKDCSDPDNTSCQVFSSMPFIERGHGAIPQCNYLIMRNLKGNIWGLKIGKSQMLPLWWENPT